MFEDDLLTTSLHKLRNQWHSEYDLFKNRTILVHSMAFQIWKLHIEHTTDYAEG